MRNLDYTDKINFLKTISLCENLDDETLERLANICVEEIYKKRSVVFFEKEGGKKFYIIHSGKIKITKLNKDGNEIILAILSTGDFFGEMSIIDGNTRSANVVTYESVRLFSINADNFLAFIHTTPVFTINILRSFAARLRITDLSVKSLFLDDAHRRVLTTLYSLAEKLGYLKNDDLIIDDMPKQTDLAAISCTSRETLSRVLKKLESNGIIIRREKDLVIPNYNKFKGNYFKNE